MKKFQEIPFHSFFVGIYIVLFVYAHNAAKLRISMTFSTILISTIVAFIIYSLAKLAFKNRIKAGIFSTLLLFGLFSYGFFYNNLEEFYYSGSWPFVNIHRYLVGIYLSFFVLVFVLIYRSKRKLLFVNYFFNVLLLTIILFNIVILFQYQISSKGLHSLSNQNPFFRSIEVDKTPVPEAQRAKMPNVYYIILDGYANDKILKKYYNFSNEEFIGFLRNKGFYIAEESMTNYPNTRQSLSSSLNVNYIDSLTTDVYPNSGESLISQNFVSYLFKMKGYQIVHIPSGYAITNHNDLADKEFVIYGPNEFERSILRLTIFRLDDLTGIFAFLRLSNQFKILPEVVEQPSPKFCFIHIVCPHPPFVFNETGKLTLHTISDRNWETRNDYVSQLKYVNLEMTKFIPELLADKNGKPIIILQSDHGSWIRDPDAENVYKARSYILNAFMAPDSMKKMLYQGISPVNSFRVVFNYLFDSKLPYLRDIPPNKNVFFQDPVFKNYHDNSGKDDPRKTGVHELE